MGWKCDLQVYQASYESHAKDWLLSVQINTHLKAPMLWRQSLRQSLLIHEHQTWLQTAMHALHQGSLQACW